MSDEFEKLLGQAAIDVWSSLSRESQQLLFEAAVQRDSDAMTGLGIFLHDRHQKTAHPPKPGSVVSPRERTSE
jgi:hypothetical protein